VLICRQDNAVLLCPDAIKNNENYQMTHSIKTQEVFGISIIQEPKSVLNSDGQRKTNTAPDPPGGYQAILTHGALLARKTAARGNHKYAVPEALESLLDMLARSAAAKMSTKVGFSNGLIGSK
jgi:hypothetical protein